MNQSSKILLIEDDQKLSGLLQHYFENFGYQFETHASGQTACQEILRHKPDLVILDLMLPGKDGLSICREIRNQYKGLILMLTASGDDMDQVAALEIGVDDFVQKPLQPRVLLARIRMLLRRKSPPEPKVDSVQLRESSHIIQLNNLWINQSLQRCKLDGEVINLTPTEFNLLWCLASEPNKVFSRDELAKVLGSVEYDGLNRTVDNKIAQLRKKLKEDTALPRGIITIRGKGYLLVPDYW